MNRGEDSESGEGGKWPTKGKLKVRGGKHRRHKLGLSFCGNDDSGVLERPNLWAQERGAEAPISKKLKNRLPKDEATQAGRSENKGGVEKKKS